MERSPDVKDTLVKIYLERNIPDRKTEVEQLTFFQKSLMYIIFVMLDLPIGCEKIHSFYITDDNVDIIVWLLKEKIAYIAPDSNTDFLTVRDGQLVVFSYEKINYCINVSFTEEFDIADLLKTQGSSDEIRAILSELIYRDLYLNFKKLLTERDIDFEPTKKQLRDLRNMLENASYTEIKYVMYKVAVFYLDNIVTRRFSRDSVSTRVLASVKTFYNNTKEKYGKVPQSDPEYAGESLRIFIEDVLKQDIGVLHRVVDDISYAEEKPVTKKKSGNQG